MRNRNTRQEIGIIILLKNSGSDCVCACVRACVGVCACVRARACACVNYRRPNGWTDHDQMWHAYVDRSGNGSYINKMTPTTTRVACWGGGGGRGLSGTKLTNIGKLSNH